MFNSLFQSQLKLGDEAAPSLQNLYCLR